MFKKFLVTTTLLVAVALVLLAAGQKSRFAVKTSRQVGSAPARVWQVLGAARDWPRWWPGMQQAEIRPGLQAGAKMTLFLQGDSRQEAAELLAVAVPRELTWKRAGVLGSETMTRFTLEAIPAGTELSMESSILGPQAILARVTGTAAFGRYQSRLLGALADYLEGDPHGREKSRRSDQ